MVKKSSNEITIQIPVNGITLQGNLTVPAQAEACVIFAHGSGSSRFSPRNRFVAQKLNSDGLATLLFDLLTPEEEAVDNVTRELRFDIDLLAQRLVRVTDWLLEQPDIQMLRLAYFGASTGAAASLQAASQRPSDIQAVVSRGGRPDLAGQYLRRVQAPALFIVGEDDVHVIQLNKEAMKQINSMKKIEIIPNATHLFEEPGALEQVAELSSLWFQQFCTSAGSGRLFVDLGGTENQISPI